MTPHSSAHWTPYARAPIGIDDTDGLSDDELRARGMLIQLCRFLATWYEEKQDDDQR